MPMRDMLLAALVAAIWGGNFVAAKITVLYFPPFFSIALRFIGVAVLLAPFMRKPTKVEMHYFILLALTLGVLYFSFLFEALRLGLSIPAAILVTQLGVPFSCVMGTYYFNDRLGLWRSLGMVLALLGLTLVAGTPDVTQHLMAFFLTVISAFFWAASNVVLKKIEKVDVFNMLGWVAVLSAPCLLLLSALLEHVTPALIIQAPVSTWMAVAYTILGSTLLAYGIWYRLMQAYDISKIMPFSLLSPVIGIGAGQFFFHTPITWPMLAGGCITLAGVGIIVLRRPKSLALSAEK